MKSLLVLLSVLIGVSAHAQARVGGISQSWACSDNGDPDYLNVNLYRVGAKTYAEIEQLAGDGDDYGIDLIEVKAVNNGDDAFRTYQQVGTSTQAPVGYKNKPNHRVRGAVIRLPLVGSEGYIKASNGPIGKGAFKNYLPLECTRPVPKA